MMNRLIKALLISTLTLFAAKKIQAPLQYGKVLAQDIESTRAGAYAAPIGTGAVALPVFQRSNRVIVETDQYVYQWAELGRKTLVMPVNAEVTFWREKNVFIVLDDQAHKHRFAVVGMTARTK